MNNFQNLSERFSYKDSKPSIKSINKISKPTNSRKKLNQNLNQLPNILTHDLNLLFIGYNPSIKSSQKGHRYAHPSNQFWKLIYKSGIIDDSNINFKDDYKLPELYKIGFTDLIMRPTKSIEEISSGEMIDNIPRIISIINEYQPKIICFVGKKILESLLKFYKIKKFPIQWGLQPLDFQLKNCINYNFKIYLVPSTSGLVRISIEIQLNIWKDLNEILSKFKSIK
ncbi:hypothetical protein WICMUC_003597 [Wickerhamomyces mucosus]|uniref:Uracil-DNA glycosylase-like domain-containing protein n=1 Tax=Wickerhamomyces mucosus TaxID=1378264 RepID=A0A9P8TCQ8_9ASCO|nr:hypothetical protein WICMUC_003597 [Wickerhamomyces mucosus]